jgi:hypothetical protein
LEVGYGIGGYFQGRVEKGVRLALKSSHEKFVKFSAEVREVLCRSLGSSLETLVKRTRPFGNPLVSVARGCAD